MKSCNNALFCNEKGQSAVEYLVICTALVTMLLVVSPSHNSIYNIMSHTMQDKYKSYAFSVSISDPPSKQFDDEVAADADKVKDVLSILKEMERLIAHTILPDILHGEMPSMDSINDFVNLVKSLFK